MDRATRATLAAPLLQDLLRVCVIGAAASAAAFGAAMAARDDAQEQARAAAVQQLIDRDTPPHTYIF